MPSTMPVIGGKERKVIEKSSWEGTHTQAWGRNVMRTQSVFPEPDVLVLTCAFYVQIQHVDFTFC
jgi:hypothetical protein